jgi:AbrB family looped-hinge helix DNA binding protein
MKLAQSRVTAQGQVSVPVEVRRRLGIAPGSSIEWDADGEVVIVRRVGRFSSEDVHDALFADAPQKRSLEELREGVRSYVRKRHARR